MLTHEELEPVLYCVARKFANYKYDVNELVNAVWLIGNVQKLPDIRFAYKRIYYDIITYMRTQEGRKKRFYTQEPDYKYRTHINSMNANVVFSDNSEHRTYEMFMGEEDGNFRKVDFEDELELLLKRVCNNHLELFIVKMRLDGFNLREIGKIIGLSESRISQMMTALGKRLIVKIKNKGIGYNKKVIKELLYERMNNGKDTNKTNRKTSAIYNDKPTVQVHVEHGNERSYDFTP